MTTKRRKKAKTTFSERVGRALRRAARSARETARRYGKLIYVSRGGKIVGIKP